MTFDDDMIRVDGQFYSCKAHGVEWPPPERIVLGDGSVCERVSMSSLTDEQRAAMTHIFRGAEYRRLEKTDAE